MKAPPFSDQIPPLTALRWFAAAWVVIFHFAALAGTPALLAFPLVHSGYLGVDFFFVLSGFVLTHVYMPQITTGRFDYWSFVAKRFARIYPMHIAMLGVFMVIGVAGRMGALSLTFGGISFAGIDFAVLLRALVANLTLIHAWGSTGQLFFNLPSWSISAEWFAYLIFPVLVLLRRLPPRREGAKVMLVAAIFLVLAIAYQALIRTEMTQLTWNVGILRIFPEFLLGMSLHRAGERWSAGARGAIAGLLAGLLLTAASVFAGAQRPDFAAPAAAVAVLGLAATVFFAADADRHGRLGWLGGRLPVMLGEISYSVYMVHLAVGILFFDVLFAGAEWPSVGPAVTAIVTGLLAATLLSWLTYHFIEVPGRRWIVDRARSLQPAATERLHAA